MNNNGFQNERDFVELFNNKYLYELDERSIVFLKELFGEVVNGKIKWFRRLIFLLDIKIMLKVLV